MDTSSNPSIKRTQRDYTLAFKLAVVEQVEKGDMTYKQAQKLYGIQGRSTVLVWLRKHGQQNWSSRPGWRMNKKPETPEQKIKRLEQELQGYKDKELLVKTALEIIDTEYGGNLRKKYSDMERDFYKKKGR
tara:strand:+ start:119 stop:511 length:393 start_codon:yes stop_codon:yes gene_type:complete